MKERLKDDAYETPTWLVETFLSQAFPDGLEGRRILEPACGSGRIVSSLQRRGALVDVADVNGVKLARCAAATGAEVAWYGDFTKYSGGKRWDMIITNPPYRLAQDFVEKALEHAEVVVMLLRVGFAASKGRYALHREHPSDIYVSTRRPSFAHGKTDATEYGWFVWGLTEGAHWWSIMPKAEDFLPKPLGSWKATQYDHASGLG